MTNSRRPSPSKRSYYITLVAFITLTMVISALVAFEPTSAWPIRSGQIPIAVQTITLEQDPQNQNEIEGMVQVQTRGVGVPGAQVYVTLEYPDGDTVSLDAETSRAGRASFVQPINGNGEYTLTVTDVKRSHFKYNASLNQMTSASVDIGNVELPPDIEPPPGEDPPGEDPPGEDPPGEDPPGEDPPGEDPPGEDPPGEDPPGEDPPGEDPPHGDHDGDGSANCGESANSWHPPVVNGCETGHEHGDAPPDWIAAAGYEVSFHGHFNTSATENTAKHAAMKGFSTTMDGIDMYFRVHAASNVLDRSARFHSYEIWARDGAGNVSHWQGWYDTGDPVTDRIPRTQGDPGNRPIMLVVDQASWDAGIRCEQWYMATAGWSWSFGWTICNTTTLFYPGENNEQGMENWEVTGSTGTNRRLEAAWYGPDSQYAPNRGNPPKDVVFWATQFGEIVSGPDDPACSATTSGLGMSFQNVCLDQYIASTMTSVEFPDNAVQKEFPSQGVLIPN